MQHLKRRLLAFDGEFDEAHQIVDIDQIARLLAGTPHRDAAGLAGHGLGHRGPEYVAPLQVELVVRAKHVGVADDGMLGHTQPAEELAHFLDIELVGVIDHPDRRQE